jgi:wobble nucleotide-excising tRNase
MLRNYLGRGDIELSPVEGAFQIRRNGSPIAGPLSEGEKTAVALCYFLSALTGDGRRIKDLIVAVDDPISSLDTRALHYAFNIIRRTLEDSGQLIVLTHNLHFMGETKKWLKNRARPADKTKAPTASLLFVESLDAGNERSSALIPMPTHIRDYESEYHYLFSLLCRFASDPAVQGQYLYLMPNALRKVLEIFLAFHLPGTEGVADKLVQVARKVPALDSAQVAALDRFAQTESHSDNLDDLVSLSSMTLEETTRAVAAVFALMAQTAPEHLARMKRMCTPRDAV